ncbi:MAG: DUF4282 domain-containing protein [Actinomycetota bacterium]
MGEYLSFRRMITPVFIQIIFWIAVAAIVQIADGNAVSGVLVLILGPIGARIYAEILIVIFRIQDDVATIRGGKAPAPSAEPTAG